MPQPQKSSDGDDLILGRLVSLKEGYVSDGSAMEVDSLTSVRGTWPLYGLGKWVLPHDCFTPARRRHQPTPEAANCEDDDDVEAYGSEYCACSCMSRSVSAEGITSRYEKCQAQRYLSRILSLLSEDGLRSVGLFIYVYSNLT